MANANTNIMSVNISQPAASTGSNSKNSGLSKYSSSQKGGNDFNSALDRANEKLNQQNQPAQAKPSDSEDIQYTDATAQNPAQPVEAKSTKTQGQNQQPQDAPQSVPTEKVIPAEIDVTPTETVPQNIEINPAENLLPEIEIDGAEIVDAPEIPAAVPYLFTANTETLLPAQNTEKVGEINLMTIMPKNDGNKSQAMLNILSGKTWTAEDVQATLSPQPQTPQNTQINPETLPIHQVGKNLNPNPAQNQNSEIPAQILQPQSQQTVQIQQPTLNLEQPAQPQMQAQTQQPTLNLEQSAQTQQPTLNLEQPAQPQQPTLSLEQPAQPQVQPQMQAQPQFEIPQQPILNSVQPQVDAKQVNQQPLSDLLGANIQVDENSNVAPLPPAPPLFRQQSEQNQQQLNQNLQQNFSQDLNSEIQTQQQNTGVEETFAPNLTPANNNVSNTQTVTQTPNPETAAQLARENESIPAQIVQQARMIRSAENTEMVINLKPEHLGQLTLRVSVSQNGAVNASFYSDNAQVRAAIENSLVQLRQELNEQGLKVENVQVYAGLTDGGLMNGQSGQAWQQNQSQNATPRRINFDALQEDVDATTPDNESISADGVDYKI